MENFMKVCAFTLCILLPSLAFSQLGIASYYGDEFHGRSTASGEKYDKTAFTAAHKEFPFGTMVRVTRLDTKQSVTVKVNDRGPYIKGRIVDLSKAAADKLDMVKEGHVEVKVEIVNGNTPAATTTVIANKAEELPTMTPTKKPTNTQATSATKVAASTIPQHNTTKQAVTTTPKKVVTTPKGNNTATTAKTKTATTAAAKPKVNTAKPAPKATPKPVAVSNTTKAATTAAASKNSGMAKMPPKKDIPVSYEIVKGTDYEKYDLYKVQVLRPEKKGFGVQVASLSVYENVLKKIADLQGKWFENVLIKVEESKEKKPIYKIILGPFPDQKTATSYKKSIKTKYKLNGFVVDLSKK